MKAQPLIIEKLINAPSSKVWQAITERDEMKKWYFDLKEFKAEPGFKFDFSGGTDEKQYLHHCEVKEVIPGKKLSYTWTYEGEPGESLVSFELNPEGENTRVRLTHAGLDSFPKENPDLKAENFEKGWQEIIGSSLKNYIEKGIVSTAN